VVSNIPSWFWKLFGARQKIAAWQQTYNQCRQNREWVGSNGGVFIGVGAWLHASNGFQGRVICSNPLARWICGGWIALAKSREGQPGTRAEVSHGCPRWRSGGFLWVAIECSRMHETQYLCGLSGVSFAWRITLSYPHSPCRVPTSGRSMFLITLTLLTAVWAEVHAHAYSLAVVPMILAIQSAIAANERYDLLCQGLRLPGTGRLRTGLSGSGQGKVCLPSLVRLKLFRFSPRLLF
jgi:hypothetical protein